MEDLYLNSASKKNYQRDFERLKLLEDGFWSLDSKELVDACERINRISHFQSLYSKHKPDEESYLFMAYSQEVELELFRHRIPQLMSLVPCAFYEFMPPRANLNKAPASFAHLACVSNEDYFRLNHIRIGLREGSVEEHKLFWSSIAQVFSY